MARSLPAWNHWYHVNGNTYGTWLRGDPRGWRARHHREHVEGDYKNPPAPGTFDALYARSRALMTREAVRLGPEARRVACEAIVAALQHHHVEVVAACVDDHHFHLLARFPRDNPRKFVGIAKKESARALSSRALAEAGGVWAVRFRAAPIADRGHQVQVARYILAHASRGAVVWFVGRGAGG